MTKNEPETVTLATPETTSASSQYVEVLSDFSERFQPLEQRPPEELRKALHDLQGDLEDQCVGRGRSALEELGTGGDSNSIKAVHYGYVAEGIASLVNTGSVYFDSFVFQEYLSRGIVETELTHERCMEMVTNINDVLSLEPLIRDGIVMIVPNEAFATYAQEPPAISSPSLEAAGQYLLPTLQLSGAIGAVPYTTWTDLQAPVFRDFRSELYEDASVHPEVSRAIWQASLTIDVFRQVIAENPSLPLLQDVSAEEVLATRARFSSFREELRLYSSTRYDELTQSEVEGGAERVAEALRSALSQYATEKKANKRKKWLSFGVGNLLTALGLTPFALLTYLAAGTSFAKSSIDLWRELGRGPEEQTGENLVLEGLFHMGSEE